MNIALVLAAGSGVRMGNSIPKQFIEVNGKPLFIYSVEAFQNNKDVQAIIIATSEESIDRVCAWCKKYNLDKVKMVVKGGETRQQSVYNGLKAVEGIIESPKDIFLIHDSARPLVSQRIIDDNISLCKQYGAIDTVIQANDTIIQSENKETINKILNRDELYQTQTPQTFFFDIIKDAHEKAQKENIPNVTDDCRLVMHFGHDIHFVNGDKLNFKVTTASDLKMFEALVK